MTNHKRPSWGEQKSRTIVISQPMYFPWIGQLEQIRMADTFVFYDDVQFSRGGFLNRVQIKRESGVGWMTVPLQNQHLGQPINETMFDLRRKWQQGQLDSFWQAYRKAPFLSDAMELMSEVFNKQSANLAEISSASVMAMAAYFDIDLSGFLFSHDFGIPGHGSQRVIDICERLQADVYLTGHGAANYLDHEAFELRGIDVSYIKYGCAPYPQQHGTFTPYVSALDLVANCGPEGRKFIQGTQIPWREFLASRQPGRVRAHT